MTDFIKIYQTPSEVEDNFKKFANELIGSSAVIAEDMITGRSVCIGSDRNGSCIIGVFDEGTGDSVSWIERTVLGKDGYKDITKTVGGYYEKYLDWYSENGDAERKGDDKEVVVEDLDRYSADFPEELGAMSDDEFESLVSEREDSLYMLALDYLSGILFTDEIPDDFIESFIDMTCDIINENGIPVYRPGVTKDASGDEVRYEYLEPVV